MLEVPVAVGRIVGDKVVLREFRPEDISGMRAWATDPEVTRYLSSRYMLPQTWEQTEDYLRGVLSGDAGGANFVIAEKGSLNYLGQCNLVLIDQQSRKATLAIVMPREHHGKGYGGEAIGLLLRFAFDQMNLNRVSLHVIEDNPRAIALYERCGFRLEGRLRQEQYQDGRYKDILVMGALRDEYRAMHENGRD